MQEIKETFEITKIKDLLRENNLSINIFSFINKFIDTTSDLDLVFYQNNIANKEEHNKLVNILLNLKINIKNYNIEEYINKIKFDELLEKKIDINIPKIKYVLDNIKSGEYNIKQTTRKIQINKYYVRAKNIYKKLGLDEQRNIIINGTLVCNFYAAGLYCNNNCSTHIDYYKCKNVYCNNVLLWNDKYNKENKFKISSINNLNQDCIIKNKKNIDYIKNLCTSCMQTNVVYNDLYFFDNYCRNFYYNGIYYDKIPNIFYENDKIEIIEEFLYYFSKIDKNIIKIIISYYELAKYL